MKTFTLEIDNASNVRFTGELVAGAASEAGIDGTVEVE